jgi:hypothetical protein
MANEGQLSEHNVVATFTEPDRAQKAILDLQEKDVPLEHISFLAREDERRAAHAETVEETELPADVAKNTIAGGTAGAVGGGAAGFLAGAIAFGIPGVGPGVGVGIWAATIGGATAGAAAGGVAGGIRKMWDERYEDAVKEGRLVVGVHTDMEAEAGKAAQVFVDHDADNVDRFDPEGNLITR